MSDICALEQEKMKITLYIINIIIIAHVKSHLKRVNDNLSCCIITSVLFYILPGPRLRVPATRPLNMRTVRPKNQVRLKDKIYFILFSFEIVIQYARLKEVFKQFNF